jgi:hypothetical protein
LLFRLFAFLALFFVLFLALFDRLALLALLAFFVFLEAFVLPALFVFLTAAAGVFFGGLPFEGALPGFGLGVALEAFGEGVADPPFPGSGGIGSSIQKSSSCARDPPGFQPSSGL